MVFLSWSGDLDEALDQYLSITRIVWPALFSVARASPDLLAAPWGARALGGLVENQQVRVGQFMPDRLRASAARTALRAGRPRSVAIARRELLGEGEHPCRGSMGTCAPAAVPRESDQVLAPPLEVRRRSAALGHERPTPDRARRGRAAGSRCVDTRSDRAGHQPRVIVPLMERTCGRLCPLPRWLSETASRPRRSGSQRSTTEQHLMARAVGGTSRFSTLQQTSAHCPLPQVGPSSRPDATRIASGAPLVDHAAPRPAPRCGRRAGTPASMRCSTRSTATCTRNALDFRAISALRLLRPHARALGRTSEHQLAARWRARARSRAARCSPCRRASADGGIYAPRAGPIHTQKNDGAAPPRRALPPTAPRDARTLQARTRSARLLHPAERRVAMSESRLKIAGSPG